MGQENIPRRGSICFLRKRKSPLKQSEIGKIIIQVRCREYQFENFSFKIDEMQQQNKNHRGADS